MWHHPSASRKRPQGRPEKGSQRGWQGALCLLPPWSCPSSPYGHVRPSAIPLPPSADSWTPQSHHPQRQIHLSMAHPLKTHHLSPQGRSVYFRVRRGLREESLWPCPVPDNIWTNQYIRLLCTEAQIQRGQLEELPCPCSSASFGVPELSPTSAAPLGGSHGPRLLFFSALSFLRLLKQF